MTLIDGRGIKRRSRKAWIVDINNPQALARCDGCGFPQNHVNLHKRMQYRGGSVPVWDGFLVCDTCNDVPNPYFARVILSPDPVPIDNPRPFDQTNSGFGYLVTENGEYLNTLTDEDTWGGEFIITIEANP